VDPDHIGASAGSQHLTDGHEHGWPCFANSAIADFFLSLP
jgi:hypothetical protein